ncbi:MAG: hypothetical protein WA635_11610 [Gallionella sp.]
MKSVHLVIPDLFLPKDIAAEVCADLRLPALEKLLGKGRSENLRAVPLESHLCELFGVTCAADAPIAPVSAAFDGLEAGYWLRADPVHLRLQRDQMLLAGVMPGVDEAAQFCASLNDYFSGQGMEFFAPHPQRWYVRLDALPRIRTTPLSGVLGGNMRGALPTGEDAARWHQVFNEVQMVLFAHPLNQAREARNEPMINSVWFWGVGGSSVPSLNNDHTYVSSDEILVEMFAAAAGVPFAAWSEQWDDSLSLTLSQRERGRSSDGRQLLVWVGLRSALQRGDLTAWRDALQDFETGYAQPLWQALRSGKLEQLEMDILGDDGIRRVMLKRRDTWAFWRRARRLSEQDFDD